MDVRLVSKLNKLRCDYTYNLKSDLDIKNYGLKDCCVTGQTDLDKNPKYVKIVSDLLLYYTRYTDEELEDIDSVCNPDPNCVPVNSNCPCPKTCNCNIFKIIKKI